MTLVQPDLDDPFAGIAEARADRKAEIVTAGRYRLPYRDGSHKPYGWQRVTNLVSAFSDQFGLRMWEIEQVVKAIAWDHNILDELMHMVPFLATLTKQQKRERIERFVERCKSVSGGDAGAKFGNLRHAQVEADHMENLPPAATDAFARQHLYLYREALIRNRLEAVPGMQERILLIEELEAAGTSDNMLRDLLTGLVGIGDLKTKAKRFYTWLEVAAQFATYAHAVAMWEPSEEGGRSGRWVDVPAIRQDVAYLLHMPRETDDQKPRVDIYEVDIERGWEIAKLSRQVVRWRSEAKRKGNPMAWLRDAPPISETETFAARFAAIETMDEGRRLVQEAKTAGMWSAPLAVEAERARVRILAQDA